MEKDYYGDIITLTNENGDDIDFEIIGSCKINDTEYFAIVPAGSLGESRDIVDYSIIKNVSEDGEEYLVSIEDDDEFDIVSHHFDEIFADDMDF